MNGSMLETSKKEPEKKKDIREIYLQAVKRNKGTFKHNA